ncbi:aminotransferase class I/II-fold pyridoxal phosphate-dependent enzyme [Alkalihalobacillus deserti]|uniref:aminotransferase class I/II-fold pyridoxal phosphate-dependent enzyme n=1 Tax=Alkalihalobacillus deserti TaxID=2879466 RepID=UPI001D1426D2|nr:aminotransferase class I/II-fold pyridoxal phosphate-dependent enzyme [Alkalihalobacillus deserti]
MNIPLIKALQDHQKNKPISLHVPGHKNGRIFHPALADFNSVLPYDVTELNGLDDLHAPTGVILQAEQAAAKLYKTAETLFLVGGTTVGNLAMMYGLFEPGDVVFIQRNSHKSIFHAAQIAGVTPVLLSPEIDLETGLAIGLRVETLEEAIKLYPEAKGLVLTYPNYYGVSLPVQSIIEYAKQNQLLILADEAHAAHYCIGTPFPPSTLELGADVAVQSAHKMLPALTMSSFLHISHKLNYDMRHSIKEALAMFQSSSASYLLMASLDGARAYIESLDEMKITNILAGVEQVKKELATIKQIQIVNWQENYLSDPLKVTIRTTTKLTGFELQSLFYQHHLYTELADEKHVLLVFGLGENTLPQNVLYELAETLNQFDVVEEMTNETVVVGHSRIKKLGLSAKQIRSLPKKKVALPAAIGMIAAEPIIPYPPGIPIVIPGEKVDAQTIAEIEMLKQAGAKFQSEHELKDVWVVNSEDEHE